MNDELHSTRENDSKCISLVRERRTSTEQRHASATRDHSSHAALPSHDEPIDQRPRRSVSDRHQQAHQSDQPSSTTTRHPERVVRHHHGLIARMKQHKEQQKKEEREAMAPNGEKRPSLVRARDLKSSPVGSTRWFQVERKDLTHSSLFRRCGDAIDKHPRKNRRGSTCVGEVLLFPPHSPPNDRFQKVGRCLAGWQCESAGRDGGDGPAVLCIFLGRCYLLGRQRTTTYVQCPAWSLS